MLNPDVNRLCRLVHSVLAAHLPRLMLVDPNGEGGPHMLKWPATDRGAFGYPTPIAINYLGRVFDLVFAEYIHEPQVLRRNGPGKYERMPGGASAARPLSSLTEEEALHVARILLRAFMQYPRDIDAPAAVARNPFVPGFNCEIGTCWVFVSAERFEFQAKDTAKGYEYSVNPVDIVRAYRYLAVQGIHIPLD